MHMECSWKSTVWSVLRPSKRRIEDGAQFVPLRHFDGFWFFGFCLVFL